MSTANQKGGGEVHVTSLDLFKNTVTTIADSKKDNREIFLIIYHPVPRPR